MGYSNSILPNLETPAIIEAMQRSALDFHDPALSAIRGKFDQALIDASLCRMIDRWLNQYPRPAIGEFWPLVGMGILGGDGCALKLASLIPRWAGNRYNKRALYSLEVLRAIGTDTALMVLDSTAWKLKLKSIKERCSVIFDEIAAQRGISRQQLDDRFVPDCGLDARGERIFDFGGRSFRFVLKPGLKAAVKDAAHRVRDNLPPVILSDDASIAAVSLAEWKVFKKQVQETLKSQSNRLEQTMVSGRRWPLAEFKSLIVDHPLMTRLAQLLIWGSYRDGHPLVSFRISEDRLMVDRNEAAMNLDPANSIGVLHPLHLSADDLGAWGEMLADYQIVPPFPQLGRPVFRPTPEDFGHLEITRFNHVQVHAASLVGGLNSRGWQKGVAHDGGILCEHCKHFIAGDVTAIVQYDPGVYIASWHNSDPQKISRCYFLPGQRTPKDFPADQERVPLHKVDPVVFSEVMMDLNSIASRPI